MLTFADLHRYARRLVQQIETLPKDDPQRLRFIKDLLKVNDTADEGAARKL